jgi:hypothetical protein
VCLQLQMVTGRHVDNNGVDTEVCAGQNGVDTEVCVLVRMV